jgi:hypothetical protein
MGTRKDSTTHVKDSSMHSKTSFPHANDTKESRELSFKDVIDRLKAIEISLDTNITKDHTHPEFKQNTKVDEFDTKVDGFDFYTASLYDDKKQYKTHKEFRSTVVAASKGAMKYLLQDVKPTTTSVVEPYRTSNEQLKLFGQDNSTVELLNLSLLQEKLTAWKQNYSRPITTTTTIQSKFSYHRSLSSYTKPYKEQELGAEKEIMCEEDTESAPQVQGEALEK